MDRDDFDRALRAFTRRTPFYPFTIELVSGSTLRVSHPEALASFRGTAVHFDENGIPTLFDASTVARLTGTENVASLNG